MTETTALTKQPVRRSAPQPAVTGAASGGYLRHIFALAKRSLIKMYRTPEALIDVTLQPIIFLLLFTYIFGGAIGGSSADYLQFLLPGVLVQLVAFAGASIGVNPVSTSSSKSNFGSVASARASSRRRWSP